MALFEWTDDLSVGNKTIDNQHKGLVNILNEVYAAVRAQKSIEDFSPFIIKLLRYAREHFETEEQMMEDRGFPHIEEHKKQHAYFLDQIDSMGEKIENKKKSTNAELLVFLKNWLVKHIKESDSRYTKYALNWSPDTE